MNIMELAVGEIGVDAGGTRYRVLRDGDRWLPGLGRRRVRFTVDQHGRTHSFLRGIEVERAKPADHRQEDKS